MIVKHARFEVRKESVPQASAAVKAFVDEVTRKEGGTARFEAYQAAEAPTRFVLVMAFRVQSADDYHQKTAWRKRFVEAITPLCTVPLSVEALSPL